MEPVGEFQDKNPDVALDRSEDVLEVVHLLLVGLCNRSDKKGHVISESLTDIFNCIFSVFDNIMKKCRANDCRVSLPHFLHHNQRYCKRVKNVGEPAVAELFPMGFLCKVICAFNKV